MTAEHPVRYPDVRSRPLMTTRAWWLVGLNILIPGSAQVLAGSRRLGRFGLGATLVLWVLAVAAIVVAVVDRTLLLPLVTNSWAIGALVVVAAFYGVLWIVLTLDTLRLVRFVHVLPSARGLVAGLALVVLVGVSGTAGYAVVNGVAAMRVLETVFGSGIDIAEPIDGRYNILLLGGDAGPDRMGLRPDSISVVSVDADSGAITILGVPRNLAFAPFAEGSPLYGPFPNGYDCGVECLISYLYTYGEDHPELYPDAAARGSRPGIEAMRDAVEGALGVPLQYYVLVDMQGFAQLIDALGGIDIDVESRVPLGSNTHDDGRPADPIGYIEPGQQRMDGATALWYARSRYATTDYERMQRQRQVQEAIIAQANPLNVIANFQDVADAGSQVVSTDIPQGMLSHFAGLAEDSRAHPVATLDLVPPEFDPDSPDYGAIRSRVDEVLSADDSGG